MSFLLKILKGMNAGAEIALAEGAVTFGSGDGCDIVIADSTLPEEAFVIETAEDGLVTLKILPDGEAKVLEPYAVFSAGGMEFVVGCAGEPWGTLRRPEDEAPPPAAEPDSADVDEPAHETEEEEGPPAAEEENGEGDGESRDWRTSWIWRAALAAILVLLCLFAGCWLLRSRRTAGTQEPVCAESLERVAADTGLGLSEIDGRKVLRGNFVRRRDRMAVAARARAADRTVTLDLSDDETLRSGVDETLFMLTDGRIVAESASNRCVRLAGTARTRKDLLDTVAALCADVSRLKTVDDTAVVCGDGLATPAPTIYRPVRESAPHPFAVPKSEPKPASALPAAPKPVAPKPVAAKALPGPSCPVVGLIVTPYPCLVLRDGSRACEGAVIGGWTVMRISADGVLMRQGGREVLWTP